MLYNAGMDTTIRPNRRKPTQLPTDGLPNKLRKYRIDAGLSMPALAEKIGVTMQAVHEAEIHGTGIGKAKWYQLADLFDVDPRILESP